MNFKNLLFLVLFIYGGTLTVAYASKIEQGQLNMVENNAPDDFDFEIGTWRIKHRKLKNVLDNSDEWIEFEGTSSVQKIMGGYGNIEDHIIHFPEQSVRALAIRSYNQDKKHWSIWWLDGRSPDSVGVPVVGRFKGGVGTFFANEVIQGIPVKVRFEWDVTNNDTPRWEQAFSKDDGQTWTTNWTMQFIRLD